MIVVAGGTGFIGSAIVEELARRGADVAVMTHSASPGPGRVAGRNFEVRTGDVEDPSSLAKALAGADAVVGAATFKGFPNQNPRKGLTFDRIDRQGTLNLLAAAQAAGVGRYVYVSGVGAAPDSDKVWYRAKAAAETAVRESGLSHFIVRPSWVYGAHDRTLNRYVAFVKSPLPVVPVIGNGAQQLQPVFVEDVARLVADALTDAQSVQGVFEIGGPEVLTMDGVIRAVEATLARNKPLFHQPAGLVKALFSPKALLPALPIPLTPQAVDFATGDAIADNSALVNAFPGFQLTTLKQGLESYLRPPVPSSGRP
jgi:NADH dehydrogenase